MPWRFFMALLAVAGSGCGTLLNMREENDAKCPFDVPPRSVYGGVRLDATQLAGGIVTSVTNNHGEGLTSSDWAENVPFLILLTADLPLSAAADTLTLPITSTKWVLRPLM